MQTFKATEDLIIEAHPSRGAVGDKSLLRLRSLSTEADGEPQAVIIYAHEVKSLVAALVEAAVWLVSVGPGDSDNAAKERKREMSQANEIDTSDGNHLVVRPVINAGSIADEIVCDLQERLWQAILPLVPEDVQALLYCYTSLSRNTDILTGRVRPGPRCDWAKVRKDWENDVIEGLSLLATIGDQVGGLP